MELKVQKSRKCTFRKYFNPWWVLSILESRETAAHKVCVLKHLEKVRLFRLSSAAGSLITYWLVLVAMHRLVVVIIKGQLISKCPFGVFKSSQKEVRVSQVLKKFRYSEKQQKLKKISYSY